MEMTRNQLKIYRHLPLSNPIMLASWLTQDIGNVGTGVIHHLRETRTTEEIAELDPLGFFAFDGAIFKDDLIQIPQSKFEASPQDNLLLFWTDEPMYEKYQFLKTIIEFCRDDYQTQRLYSFNGNPSLLSHDQPRRVFVVCNREELLNQLPLEEQLEYMDWEGPPAMSTYLMWMAEKNDLEGITIWVEVPFYLSTVEDAKAIKSVLSLLEKLLQLDLKTEKLDDRIAQQETLLNELQEISPETKEAMDKISREELIEETEQINLTKKVYEYFKQRE